MIKLDQILNEMDSIVYTPILDVFAFAIINDHLMDCRCFPLNKNLWELVVTNAGPSSHEKELIERRGYQPPFTEFQLTYLAQVLKNTSLAQQCVAYFDINKANKSKDGDQIVASFLHLVRTLPLAMIQTNPVRKEEFLRKWLTSLTVPVANETENQSLSVLKKMDYTRTLLEAEEAEKKLKSELENRKKAMEELQRQASDRYNRGSYE